MGEHQHWLAGFVVPVYPGWPPEQSWFVNLFLGFLYLSATM